MSMAMPDMANGRRPRAAPLVEIDDESAKPILVDAPLLDALAGEQVFIQGRTGNLRIVSVSGSAALRVSPRIGPLYVTVDLAPRHFADACGEKITIIGLPAGEQKVRVELADPTHRVDWSRVDFKIPDRSTATRNLEPN